MALYHARFFLCNTLKKIPAKYAKHAALVSGTVSDVLKNIHFSGYKSLYIDGGKTIQNFLENGLIDEMIISVIPIVPGEVYRYFPNYSNPFNLNRSVQKYTRTRWFNRIIEKKVKHV